MTLQWPDFLSTAPLLPVAEVMHWGWPVSWALVLAAAVAWLGQRFDRRLRWVLVAVVGLWTLWPGPVSPSYWLGLAFQSPSLTSAVLSGAWLLQRALEPPWGIPRRVVPLPAVRLLWALGVVLGWVLLGDTLAWWQVSVYAWGFNPATLALACAVLSLVWLVSRRDRRSPQLTHLLALTLVLFVATRLPSGNVWDALLDPWLWLLLQGAALRALWRSARQ